jgi:hypothetical protein
VLVLVLVLVLALAPVLVWLGNMCCGTLRECMCVWLCG